MTNRQRTSIKPFNTNDQINFLQMLADLLDAGYAVNQALTFTLGLKTNYHERLLYIHEQLSFGQPVWQSMRPLLPESIILQLRIAEQHGRLTKTLKKVGVQVGERQRQKAKLKQVTRYPIFLIGLLILMLMGMKLFLWPVLAEMQMQQQVVTNTDLSLIWWLVGTGSLFLLVGAFIHWHRLNAYQKINRLCQFPAIGRIVQMMVTQQLAMELSLLIESGLSVNRIIAEVAQLKETRFSKLLAFKLKANLQSGVDLRKSLRQERSIHPTLIGYFETGTTDQKFANNLATFGDLKFKQIMTMVDNLLATLQPILFGVIGLVIIGLYLAMLLPMYHSIGGMYS